MHILLFNVKSHSFCVSTLFFFQPGMRYVHHSHKQFTVKKSGKKKTKLGKEAKMSLAKVKINPF